MGDQNFQDRIAKIEAAHAAEGRRAPRLPDYGSHGAAHQNGKLRSARRDLFLVPITFLCGACLVLAGRLVMYHYLSDTFAGGSVNLGLMSMGVGQQSMSLIFTGLVGMLFLVHKAVMLFFSHMTGSSLVLFKEGALMQLFPDVWSALYSPLYVNRTLFEFSSSFSF